MKAPLFSVILYVDIPEMLSSAISFYNEENLNENIQLIILTPTSEKGVQKSAGSFKGENSCLLLRPGIQMSEAYQEGMGYAKGRYVNFALSSSRFSKDAFSKFRKAFEAYPGNMVCAAPFYSGKEETPYGGSFRIEKEEERIQLLKEGHEEQIQLLLQAYCFRREVLEGHFFRTDLQEDALYEFLLSLQLENPDYLFRQDISYLYTVPLEDDISPSFMNQRPGWYEHSIRSFHIPLLQSAQSQFGEIPLFVQNACYYLIFSKINCNLQNRNNEALKNQEEADSFFNAVFKALIYIDNDVILRKDITPFVSAIRWMRMFLLRGKAKVLGKKAGVREKDREFRAYFEPGDGESWFLEKITSEPFIIRTMNYRDGILCVEGYLDLADYFPEEKIETYAVCEDEDGRKETVRPEYTDIYPLLKCFGIVYSERKSVRFLLPLGDKRKTWRFYFRVNGKEYQFRLSFRNYTARIYTSGRDAYWKFRRGWMLRSAKSNSELVAEKCGFILQLKKEIRFCESLFKDESLKGIRFQGIFLRILYWFLQPFLQGRHIWVTFDKLYKAGDNGEYFFRYVRKNQRSIHMYYIVMKDSADYKRLKKQFHGHILVYGTFRCMLVSLLSEVILGTHSSINKHYIRDSRFNAFTKDLQKGDVICIQHGLSINQIANIQNRLRDNTKLYCCASHYEIENLKQPVYGYNENQLALTGLARYDGLKNEEEKIVLISPTWRPNTVNVDTVSTKRDHNPNFKNTDYFKIYDRLINDELLISCAKKFGYRIIYLVHPAVSAQINDFTKNDYLELLPGADVDYEEILCRGSLLITDYSGLQFDFAYMRKPLIYYHPAELPPHYEEGGLIYETMGFGPICREHDDLVREICKAMGEGCCMEDGYRKRADNFFAFDDHNNCERIFNAVKDYSDSRGSF